MDRHVAAGLWWLASPIYCAVLIVAADAIWGLSVIGAVLAVVVVLASWTLIMRLIAGEWG
jgi:hypothetical protein